MSSSSSLSPLLRPLLQCVACNETMVRPLLASCGHSFACAECAERASRAGVRQRAAAFAKAAAKGRGGSNNKKRKRQPDNDDKPPAPPPIAITRLVCPQCGEVLRGASRLKVNLTLGAVAALVDPDGVAGRSGANEHGGVDVKREERRCRLLRDCRRLYEQALAERGAKREDEQHDEGKQVNDNNNNSTVPGTITVASLLILPARPAAWLRDCERVLLQTQQQQQQSTLPDLDAFEVHCFCGLLSPPVWSVKRSRWMRSCPRWSPDPSSSRSSSSCSFFAWIGPRDAGLLGLSATDAGGGGGK